MIQIWNWNVLGSIAKTVDSTIFLQILVMVGNVNGRTSKRRFLFEIGDLGRNSFCSWMQKHAYRSWLLSEMLSSRGSRVFGRVQLVGFTEMDNCMVLKKKLTSSLFDFRATKSAQGIITLSQYIRASCSVPYHMFHFLSIQFFAF